jgi:hypothetical protein
VGYFRGKVLAVPRMGVFSKSLLCGCGYVVGVASLERDRKCARPVFKSDLRHSFLFSDLHLRASTVQHLQQVSGPGSHPSMQVSLCIIDGP